MAAVPTVRRAPVPRARVSVLEATGRLPLRALASVLTAPRVVAFARMATERAWGGVPGQLAGTYRVCLVDGSLCSEAVKATRS